jgi:hypothetical protein
MVGTIVGVVKVHNFIFSKNCDVNRIYVYHHSMHQGRNTLVGEGESNIPTIIPSLINS